MVQGWAKNYFGNWECSKLYRPARVAGAAPYARECSSVVKSTVPEASTAVDSTSPTTPAIPLVEGQRLAEVYVLKRALEPGGRDPVWEAHEEVLGKDVSLHFVPAAGWGDAQALQELKAEVRRSRQLIHPSILRVYEFLQEAEWCAVAMDALGDSTSLAARLREAKGQGLALAEAGPWLKQAAQTLEEAHRIQVLHRHLTPANVYVSGTGALRLAQFGISRVVAEAVYRRQPGANQAERAYLSPQQWAGEAPTRADDIYAFGVLAYEVLTGERPFQGERIEELVRTQVPPLAGTRRRELKQLEEEIPAAWEQTIAACLAKAPAERPATMAQVLAMLEGQAPLAITAPLAPAAVAASSQVLPVPPSSAPSTLQETAPAVVDTAPREIAKEAPAVTSTAPVAPLPKEKKVRRFGTDAVGSGAAAEGLTPDTAAEAKGAEPKEAPSRGPKLPVPQGEIFPRPLPQPKRGGGVAVLVGLLLLVGFAAWYFNQEEGKRRLARQTEKPTPTPTQAGAVNGDILETPKLSVEGVPDANTVGSPAGMRIPVETLNQEQVQEALATTDKTLQETAAQQQQATEAMKVTQAQLDERLKALEPMLKDTEELATQREGFEEKAQTSMAAAKEMREAAEAGLRAAEIKARQAEDAQTALSTFDKEHGHKLTFRQQAETELQKLRTELSEQQQSATEAARLRAATENARQQFQGRLTQLLAASATPKATPATAAPSPGATPGERPGTPRPGLLAIGTAPVATATPAPGATPAATPTAEEVRKQVQDEIAERERLLNARLQQATGANLPGATPPLAPPKPTPISPSVLVEATPIATPPGATPTPGPQEVAKLTLPTMGDIPLPGATVLPPGTLPGATPEPAPPRSAQAQWENSLGMPFVQMGEIWVAIWPTRVQDFEKYAAEVKIKNNLWRSPGFKQGPTHPVVNVSWFDAMAFCSWLTDKERRSGQLPKTEQYRLPTDQEWSQAVGLENEKGATPSQRDLGVQDVFPWGKDWPPPPGVGNYTGAETGSQAAITAFDDGYTWTSPVGSFKANALGLYDMGGNVWQWCMDEWQAGKTNKVLRGASWYDGALKLSLFSSSRIPAKPESSADNHGFRIVRAKVKK